MLPEVSEVAQVDALQRQVQAAQLLVLKWRGQVGRPNLFGPAADIIVSDCAEQLAERIGMPPAPAREPTP